MALTVHRAAHRYLLVGAASYLMLFVYGRVVSQSLNVNSLPVNPADDVLHLLLGITMVQLGLVLNRCVLMRPGGMEYFSVSPDKSRERSELLPGENGC